MFLDFAVSLILWFVIIVTVAFIVANLRKDQCYRPYVRKAFCVALVIAALATIPSLMSSQPTRKNLGVAADPADRLSSTEKTRFREILAGVIQDPDYLTLNVHAEFWTLLDKMGPLSPSEVQKLRDMMTGTVTIYQRYFYEDALWALKAGRAFKSLQRERYEKHLLNLDVITEWRIKENDTLIAKIAAKEPIPYQGTAVVLNEDIINEILASLEIVGKRVDTLFTSPEVRGK